MSKTFQEKMTLDKSNVLIVDALNLGFRWKHSGATKFVTEYVQTVESLKRSYSCGTVVIACDSGSSSYRKNIFPLYKQNRKDKFDQQTPEEKAAFEAFFQEFTRVVDYYKSNTTYPTLKFDRTEADDIGAYIVKNRKKLNISKIVLASSDRDWDLLIQPDVMRFSYVTRKEITLDNWSEHYDYNPDDHISIKCLTGDSGDNIPGVPGIGPKKAQSLIAAYGSTYDIIANLPIASKYKYIQNLNEFGSEQLLLNYKLMDLLEFCEEALGQDNCKHVDGALKEYINGTND